MRLPTHRPPTHPGEILLEELLKPLGLSPQELADAIQVPHRQVDEIVNRRRGVTAETALRLSHFLGTSVDFWLNLQERWDFHRALREDERG